MKLGIDIDGVLADFSGHWQRTYEAWFGVTLPPEALEMWDGHIEHTHFQSEADFWNWVDAVPRFWETMPLIDGAAGAFYQLVTLGHSVVLITNRHEKARGATEAWARRVLPSVWTPVIHHVKGDKSVVDAQLYIDDRRERIEQLRKNRRKVVRFRQPWNSGSGDLSAGSWADVLRIVEKESGVLTGQRTIDEPLNA